MCPYCAGSKRAYKELIQEDSKYQYVEIQWINEAQHPEIAEKYDLLFIPLQGKFDEAAKLAPNEYWLFDGVHPMAAGYELIKRAWMEGFCKLVGGRKLSD